MITRYLFSSPAGSIQLNPEDLVRPFLLTPQEKHPFLTLNHYFEAIKTFILKDATLPLASVLEERFNTRILPDDIETLVIKSEKHGALYHIASVEVSTKAQTTKFTVTTAASRVGKTVLAKEYDILQHLNGLYKPGYLPKVYFKEDVECKGEGNSVENLSMVLAEWFEDYHEWHYGFDQKEDRNRIRIWDMKSEDRYASEQEAFDLLKQAAKILTLYYDTQSFDQIHPWHHAAGDFIVNIKDRCVDVKLTTVRGYHSIMDRLSRESVNPVIALVYFFLNLTIRMRLDKLDGVGKTLWIEDFSVPAVTDGFFEALKIKENAGTYQLGTVAELTSLMQSFTKNELENLFQPMMCLYEPDDPEEQYLIGKNLSHHIRLLHEALSNISALKHIP